MTGHGSWPQKCPWCASKAVAWYTDNQPREYACRTQFHTHHFRSLGCRVRAIFSPRDRPKRLHFVSAGTNSRWNYRNCTAYCNGQNPCRHGAYDRGQ